MKTAWNDTEDDALLGLPLLARVLYLQGLRRYMDYQTGVVGVARGISYQSLREVLFVEPVTGRQDSGSPSIKVVRVAIEQLIRAGLIASIGAKDRLVFSCLLADAPQSVQKKEGRPRADLGQTYKGTENNGEDNDLSDSQGRPKNQKYPGQQGNPLESGIRDKEVLKHLVEPRPDHAVSATPGAPLNGEAVALVFACWQQVMGHPKAILDAKRKKAVAARLKEGFTIDALCDAVRGCKASAWHQGKNDRGQVYDDLALICRDAAQVEKFVALVGAQHRTQTDFVDWLNEDSVIDGEYSHG